MTRLTQLARHDAWSADRFYWAVIDASVLARAPLSTARRRARQLGYLFESFLPGLPIEDVHAVYTPLPGDGERYVACGVARSALADAVAPETVTLTPASLPPFVGDAVDAGRLNLLVGAFAPRSVQRLRRRWLLVVLMGIVLCAALLTLGLERRASVLRAEVARLGVAQEAVFAEVLGPAARTAVGTSFPPERRLVAELRRLEETRSDSAPVPATTDGAAALADLLALWPADVHVRAKSIAVQPTTITIRGHATAMADVQRLNDALAPLEGWTIGQPQSEVGRNGVELILRLSRDAESRGSRPVKFAPPLIIGLVLATSLLPIAVSARRLDGAARDYETASASLEVTRDRARRVTALRDTRQRAAEQRRPEQDIIARASEVLRAADLSVDALGAVSSRSDAAITRSSGDDGPEYRRQTVQLSLRRLTVPEIGRFLAGWRSTQRLWTPGQITLAHIRSADDPARYQVTILISATYIADR